jgi:predicted nuclease of predicted toxin-antitoxin system
MRFIVDECTGPGTAQWLRNQGHDVFSIYDNARGMNDDDVIATAYSESRVLITNDKDFGEKVYRERRPHSGVIFMRLDDERVANKINVLRRLLELHADRIESQFIVVTENRIRFAKD